jgi:hypothetical protein
MNIAAFVAYVLTATIQIPGQPDHGVSLIYPSYEECMAGGRLLKQSVEGNYVGNQRPRVTFSCSASS